MADDYPAIVEAVCRRLEREGDIEIAGRARDGSGAQDLIDRLQPDVAVLDIRMPPPTGIEIARTLSARRAPTRVILYTALGERAQLLDAIDAGARGFVVKNAPLADLARAVRAVAAGETYVDPALAGVVTSAAATSRLPALSPREREILGMLADGMRNEQVAHRLSISALTVRSHVKNAMVKLDADTRTQAVARALRESLIV